MALTLEGLYRLSERDELGVLIEPFLRRTQVDLAGGIFTQDAVISRGNDRATVLTHCTFNCLADATTIWQEIRVWITPSNISLVHVGCSQGMPFLPNGSTTALGQGGQMTMALDMVLPAGQEMRCTVARSGASGNNAVAVVTLIGYTVPQGTIARGW